MEKCKYINFVIATKIDIRKLQNLLIESIKKTVSFSHYIPAVEHIISRLILIQICTRKFELNFASVNLAANKKRVKLFLFSLNSDEHSELQKNNQYH